MCSIYISGLYRIFHDFYKCKYSWGRRRHHKVDKILTSPEKLCHVLQVPNKLNKRWRHYAFHMVTYSQFYQSRACSFNKIGEMWPVFGFRWNFIVVLVICKYHDHPTKDGVILVRKIFFFNKSTGDTKWPNWLDLAHLRICSWFLYIHNLYIFQTDQTKLK